MQIIDNVAATLKDLTIERLKEMGEIHLVDEVSLEELAGTVSLRLIFTMEPHQEGDMKVKHTLHTFLNENGEVMITQDHKMSYEAKDKRDDDFILNRGNLMELLLWETYFSNKYRITDRPTKYDDEE